MKEEILSFKFLEQPSQAYHEAHGMSAHALIELEKSPAHFHHKYVLGNFGEPSAAQRLGLVTHQALLEPKIFDLMKVAPKCDKRTKEGKALYARFIAELPDGAVVMDAEDYQTVQGIKKALSEHKFAKSLLEDGIPEISGFWTNLTFDMACKMRPDYLHHDDYIIDLKIVQDASPHGFQRAVANYRWDIQAAWYTDGYATIRYKHSDTIPFIFLAIESEPPHGIGVYSASEDLIEFGRKTYLRGLETYKRCQINGAWPSYCDEIKSLDLPSWMS